MSSRALALASLFISSLALATTTVTPTTTLSAETSNNTSTANKFTAQSNGNIGPSNVSKLDTRSLLYSGATTKIYAHFMGWFGPGEPHMSVGYTSSDPAQVNAQVTDAHSRGISGFILDWYGPNNSMPNQTAMQLRTVAENQNGAFQFAIMEDGGALGSCNSTPGCNLTDQIISDLTYAYNSYEVSPAYLTFPDPSTGSARPAVFFFDPDRYGTLDWARVAASVPGNPLFIFQNSGGFTHAQSSGSISWVIIDTKNANDWEQSYLDNFYQTALGYPSEHTFGATYKGFNDTLASWGSNRIMNQNCGQTWLSTFAEIGNYYSTTATQLESLQLVTWNDYEEATEIESGIDNCVAVSASVAADQLSWTISGNENTVDHYTAFIANASSSDQLMPLKDVPAGVHSLDLSSYGFAAGSYYVYVKAVGKPSMKNQMSNAVAYNTGPQPDFTLSASPSSATISRTGTATFSISVAALNGFNGTVSLLVTGLPSRSSATFTPTPISSSGTSKLTISTAKKTAVGTYTLKIAGTSGGLSHSTTVGLTVQ